MPPSGTSSESDADTGSDEYFPVVEDERLLQRLREPSRNARRPVARGVLEQHGEFVPFQVCSGVFGPEAGRDALEDPDEQAISRLVAQRVVDESEVVEIQKQYRHLAPVPVCVGEGVFQAVRE